MYPYNSTIRLSEVVLNVHDVNAQANFYSQIIGLTILKQDENEVSLGISGSGEVLVRLIQTDLPAEKNYGLYHTAILVPSRSALGASLRHLLQTGVRLTGGADHGYSEAIYLDDLEGNGIEIYRDKAVEEWDIREDGRIIGMTEELDANAILEEALDDSNTSFKLPEGTIVGHVHLSVKNALALSQLYQKIFQLGDKFSVPSASWIASGNYHHHLAFNQWAGPYLDKRSASLPGLNHLTIEMSDKIFFQASLKKSRLYQMMIIEEGENTFLMEDTDGIRTQVILVK
ncbi:VOC family protein [Streptococcus ovis]|uniref:VOC family protein n=1 Tax=Streptococcus ovis TaxID=82806 RepID=UPI000360E224|nr:VOC family protein [Streptococcus ovis]